MQRCPIPDQGRLLFIQACHCEDCQKITGGGASSEYYTYASCGVVLWVRYHKVPCIAVRTCSLEEPLVLLPRVHIFTSQKRTSGIGVSEEHQTAGRWYGAHPDVRLH